MLTQLQLHRFNLRKLRELIILITTILKNKYFFIDRYVYIQILMLRVFIDSYHSTLALVVVFNYFGLMHKIRIGRSQRPLSPASVIAGCYQPEITFQNDSFTPIPEPENPRFSFTFLLLSCFRPLLYIFTAFFVCLLAADAKGMDIAASTAPTPAIAHTGSPPPMAVPIGQPIIKPHTYVKAIPAPRLPDASFNSSLTSGFTFTISFSSLGVRVLPC